MTTTVPTAPEVGVKLVIVGAGITVKLVALVAVPPAVVTVTVPVAVPAATVAVICVSPFTVKDAAAVPLNLTAEAPVNAEPVMVTTVPTGPEVGVKLLTVGGGITVKPAELVAVPAIVVTAIVPVELPVANVAVICVSLSTV
jgi:hypothetical protein